MLTSGFVKIVVEAKGWSFRRFALMVVAIAKHYELVASHHHIGEKLNSIHMILLAAVWSTLNRDFCLEDLPCS